jgi:hypothetical protein
LSKNLAAIINVVLLTKVDEKINLGKKFSFWRRSYITSFPEETKASPPKKKGACLTFKNN